jgi:hypothetical protein
MTSENRKSVLFMGPRFFGYEGSIIKAIEYNGFDVDFFDERFSNRSFLKAVFRVKKELLHVVIRRYYNKITKKIGAKKYDYFFLIKGEVVPESFLRRFKKDNPSAKLIFYTYDSFNNNNPNSVYILKHFDKCFSFDFEDVKNNPRLQLKHLFYTDEYLTSSITGKRRYDISFVGTLHPERYMVIKKLFAKFHKTYAFFYIPAKWFFLMQKLQKKSFRRVKKEEVSFKKLSKLEVAAVFRNSESVFDLQRFGQTGLTMRTFEVLATKAILVTTNHYIKQTDFYDPEKIIVLESENSEALGEVGSKVHAYAKIEHNGVNIDKYHVNTWVKEFFE